MWTLPQSAPVLQPPPDTSLLNLNFTKGAYSYRGSKTSLTSMSGWSFTRASTGYAQNSAGLLIPFASGQPRITDLGLLIEAARTNVVLWNRDLTNAAWTKTNATVAKDQTGADGSANSASSITATAGNATVLQAVTLGSSARFQTAYIKRITGSGAVQMTMDNGSTWTAVTVTASWARVSIPTQTLANPTVGFRVVTSGDAIAVDFVQNENGDCQTSPILTTTASATRAADVASIANIWPSGQGTLLLTTKNVTPPPTLTQALFTASVNSNNNHQVAYRALSGGQEYVFNTLIGGARTFSPASAGLPTYSDRTAYAWDAAGAVFVANGASIESTAVDHSGLNPTTLYLGYDSSNVTWGVNGYIAKAALYGQRKPLAQLQALTQ